MKENCWEIKRCGREPDGSMVHELGICSAATEARLNGIHAGKNGGRCCWLVAGTFCEGEVQGTFARKLDDCLKCEFYQQVVTEEGKEFLFTRDIHKKLN